MDRSNVATGPVSRSRNCQVGAFSPTSIMRGTTPNSSSRSRVGGWKVDPRSSITSPGSAASSTVGMPRRPRAKAAVSPTGPAPTTITRSFDMRKKPSPHAPDKDARQDRCRNLTPHVNATHTRWTFSQRTARDDYRSGPKMRDVLGWRRKFGVLGPSTNTIVQPDFEMMRPAGVTNHYSRIFTPNAQAVSNETFTAGTELIGRNVLEAVRSVMTSSPDYLVMGMSAVTFSGGAAGAAAFQAKVERESGVGVSIGSHSCTAAMKAYGGVKRIAFLSPYYPVANREVARYFTESGFEVVRDIYLECKSWTAIAEVTPDVLRDKLIALNGDAGDVDAIIQVGTNLSMVRLAAAAEMWLGKPVIAINTATYWHALRQNKIADKIPGLGRLLEEF